MRATSSASALPVQRGAVCQYGGLRGHCVLLDSQGVRPVRAQGFSHGSAVICDTTS
jgi:hypothetical protein